MPVRDVNDADEAEDLSFRARLDAQVVELGVELGETRQELVAGGDALEGGWDEGRGLHGEERVERGERGGRRAGGDEAREDGELARYIVTVEIVCRVGLLEIILIGLTRYARLYTHSVAFLPSDCDNRRKGRTSGGTSAIVIENVAHSAGEDTFDFDDLNAFRARRAELV